MTVAKKKLALAHWLEVDVDEVGTSGSLFTHGSHEYRVLVGSEPGKAVKEAIEESLWAFRPEFLESITGIPAAAFKALSEQMYEDANEPIRKMVGAKMPQLIRDAVAADGRGHFLSPYDGEEHVKGIFYIYRIN